MSAAFPSASYDAWKTAAPDLDDDVPFCPECRYAYYDCECDAEPMALAPDVAAAEADLRRQIAEDIADWTRRADAMGREYAGLIALANALPNGEFIACPGERFAALSVIREMLAVES